MFANTTESFFRFEAVKSRNAHCGSWALRKTAVIVAVCLACTTVGLAGITESPEKCSSLYGEPKFQHKEDDGGVTNGYEPSFEGFGKAMVMVLFRNGKAASLRYKISGKDAFTPDQFALIATLNELSLGKKFVRVGPSPDKTKEIWSAEDNSAYMVVYADQAMVDVMTQGEAVRLIKQLPNKSPEVGKSSETEPSHFKMVKLPHGMIMELPKSWWLIGKDLNELMETKAQAALDLSGIEILPGTNTELITANSMPRSTYASARVTFSTPPIGTPEEVAGLSPSDLKEMGEQTHDLMRRLAQKEGHQILDFYGCTLATVGGSPAILNHYKRTGPHGNVLVWAYQIARPEGTVNLTMSYREAEAVLWRLILERIEKSVKFAN
jgi:hypothetical protein